MKRQSVFNIEDGTKTFIREQAKKAHVSMSEFLDLLVERIKNGHLEEPNEPKHEDPKEEPKKEPDIEIKNILARLSRLEAEIEEIKSKQVVNKIEPVRETPKMEHPKPKRRPKKKEPKIDYDAIEQVLASYKKPDSEKPSEPKTSKRELPFDMI